MSKQFWLIQRGSFADLKSDKFIGLMNDAVIRLDYMGSAEFEFGALPNAFCRLMGYYLDYALYRLDIENPNGVPFYLYCRKDRYDAILAELKSYIKDQYPLKGSSHLHAHLTRSTDDYDIYQRKTNFWWCIDKYGEIGDWMLFVGGKDRSNALMRVIMNDYSNWWRELSETERAENLKAAQRW